MTRYFLIGTTACTLSFQAQAQISIGGQIRTRTEMRYGQGTLLPKGSQAAFFTSQRTRLSVGYTGLRFKAAVTAQDVRVWGQDASTINRTTTASNNGLMLHEAWGEVILTDSSNANVDLSLKIGRQELNYDDARLLGNLDWAQQARRHDMALLKFAARGWTLHAGAAFNQNKEQRSGTAYNGIPAEYAAGTNGIGTLYKSMQLLYVARQLPWGTVSALLLKDDFNRYSYAPIDSLKKNPIFGTGVWSRFTGGLFTTGAALKKRLTFTASASYQTGDNKDGQSLSAYMASAYTLYALSKSFSMGPGVDYTSGNNGTRSFTTDHRFDPLYGTPHKFWGYMDYFYVSDGFGRSGLVDYYLRAKYKLREKWLFTLDGHQFTAAQPVSDGSDGRRKRNFGTELDLLCQYTLTPAIGFEAGYSAFFATSTLASAQVKNVADANLNPHWAYLMINIKPSAFIKVKGDK